MSHSQLPVLFLLMVYSFSIFGYKEYNQSDFGIYHLVMSMCRVFFCVVGRRDKKAFFSDRCKEIEENNRMGKTRDLLKKIRDTKGIFMQRWAQERREMVWT